MTQLRLKHVPALPFQNWPRFVRVTLAIAIVAGLAIGASWICGSLAEAAAFDWQFHIRKPDASLIDDCISGMASFGPAISAGGFVLIVVAILVGGLFVLRRRARWILTGSLAIVVLLGAWLNERNGWADMTGLMYASGRGDFAAVQILTAVFADPNVGDDTALMGAVSHGNYRCVERLIECGANVNAADSQGWTPLLYAASRRRVDCMKLLVSHGANVDAAGYYGHSALMIAASEGCTDCVAELISRRADVNARDGAGKTALEQYAAKPEIRRLLKAACAD